MGGGEDGGAEAAERFEPDAGQRWFGRQPGGPDGGVPGQARGGRRDEVEEDAMAAPRSADDDDLRVGERDDGGEDSGDGLAEDATRGRGPCARAGQGGQQPAARSSRVNSARRHAEPGQDG